MPWEIRNDYEHHRFYLKVLDELKYRSWQRWEEVLNTPSDDLLWELKFREFDRAKRIHQLVEERYELERFTRGWS